MCMYCTFSTEIHFDVIRLGNVFCVYIHLCMCIQRIKPLILPWLWLIKYIHSWLLHTSSFYKLSRIWDVLLACPVWEAIPHVLGNVTKRIELDKTKFSLLCSYRFFSSAKRVVYSPYQRDGGEIPIRRREIDWLFVFIRALRIGGSVPLGWWLLVFIQHYFPFVLQEMSSW